MTSTYRNDRSTTVVADRRRTRRELLAVLTGVAVLAMLLPSPLAVTRLLSGESGAITGDATSVAALVVAAIAVWTVLGLVGAVISVAMLARSPGRAGRWARIALRGLVPHRWHAWVGALVGITLLAGTAACGTPNGTARNIAGAPPGTTVAPALVTGPAGVAAVEPSIAAADPVLQVSGLDWPGGGPTFGAEGSPETPSENSGSPVPAPSAAQPPAAPIPPPPAPATAAKPATTPATGAASTQATPAPGAPTPPSTTPALATAAVPIAPSTAPAVTAPPTARPGAVRPTTAGTRPVVVTVRPGDSLWAIAARHLPSGANAAAVDAAWRQWYAANATVIGADPDLILPGQRLRAPDSEVTP